VGEFGGRVFYASSNASNFSPYQGDEQCNVVVYDTCVVVDICQWTDNMTICTKHRFPEVELSIVHSTTSLTGFSIVMKINPPVCQEDMISRVLSSAQHSCNGVVDKGSKASANGNDNGDHDDPNKKRGRRAPLSWILSLPPSSSSQSQSSARSMPARIACCALWIPGMICVGLRRQGSHIAGFLVAASILWAAYQLTEYIKSRGGHSANAL